MNKTDVFSSDQIFIAANPLLLLQRISLLGVICILLMIILLGVGQFYSLIAWHQPFFWEILIAIPLLAFILVKMFIRLRILQRVERLRFSHITERSNIIDSVWPTFTPSVPLSPISATLRIKRTYIGIFAVCIIGLIIPGLMSMVVQFMQQGQGSSLIFWIAFGLIPLILGFVPLFIVRTTIEARETGLRTETGKFIHWHEARLFACYTLPGLLPGRSAVTVYELSSSNQVITWRWLYNPQSPLSTWKPLLPLDEYYRQMQALCDRVIEKTGLQLYNLTQSLEEKTTSNLKF